MDIKEYLSTRSSSEDNLFGDFMKQRRLELKIRLRDMASSLAISPAYLCDIEQGNRQAPVKLIKRMAELLQISEDEMVDFEDLAYQSHNTCAPDIIQYLIANPEMRKEIRSIITKSSNFED